MILTQPVAKKENQKNETLPTMIGILKVFLNNMTVDFDNKISAPK
jgi:hypothetical protein